MRFPIQPGDILAADRLPRVRHASRHESPSLHHRGRQPQHQVIEIAPGGGWYTETLAPCLHARGRLHAAHHARDDAQEGRRPSRAAFEAKLAAAPELYGRVLVGSLPRSDAFTDIAAPGGADMGLTFRNMHNWIEDGHLEGGLRVFAGALKPGGVLGVEEIKRTGDVTEALLVERAAAAGLELQARSEVNADALDSKDHVNGVGSLPPTLRGGAVDHERFLAIGESDRFTHRYVKCGG